MKPKSERGVIASNDFGCLVRIYGRQKFYKISHYTMSIPLQPHLPIAIKCSISCMLPGRDAGFRDVRMRPAKKYTGVGRAIPDQGLELSLKMKDTGHKSTPVDMADNRK